jgi:transcriptional regulator with XRE-family HTH domain
VTTVHPIIGTLTDARQRLGYTQTDLGRMLGVGQTAVSSWERQHKRPDLDTLDRWARALGRQLVVQHLPHPDDNGGDR